MVNAKLQIKIFILNTYYLFQNISAGIGHHHVIKNKKSKTVGRIITTIGSRNRNEISFAQ
jgi:hypothetical protein